MSEFLFIGVMFTLFLQLVLVALLLVRQQRERAERKEWFSALRENRIELNERMEQLSARVDERIHQMQNTTAQQLEKMRETVDEKLHHTLDERLGQSFRLVNERLAAVQTGLGEMKTLANGVGDLKKVLSNVKRRGALGEIQLGAILEQVLAPEQYRKNVATKPGSGNHVEFAIVLPGKSTLDESVFLPIDAKFPQEDYIRLQDAYDRAHADEVEQHRRALVQAVKRQAKLIRDKYIDPPHTTDFGILFLPTEGLFAEIIRHPDLILELQSQFRIVVAGPTTLTALLNSLQMGFQTLAIQRRSSEVWEVLRSVKKQFSTFGAVLQKARERLRQADGEIEKLVTTRTRAMLSELKDIEELPGDDSFSRELE